MNAQVLATGLIGGNIGKHITDQLDDVNISHAFYPITSATRNSIVILHDHGKKTELLETGPEITVQEAASFLAQFEKIIKEADVLTLSGSRPKGVSSDFYQQLIQKSNGIPTLLDTSGQSLTDCLSGMVKPFLIKPNLSEIQVLTGRSLTVSDLRSVLSEEQFAGID